ETPIDAAYLLASYTLRYKGLHPIPKLVVECLINDPVEVVCKHASVFALRSHGCIWDEIYSFSSCDDCRTFFGRQYVFDKAEIWYNWVLEALRFRPFAK